MACQFWRLLDVDEDGSFGKPLAVGFLARMRALCLALLATRLLMAQSPVPCMPTKNVPNEPPEPQLLGLPPDMAAMFKRGVQQIRHLPPSAFPGLPVRVRQALEALGCQVPQVYGEAKPNNLIHGEFARRGQTDWAALCSNNGRFGLVIIWGGGSRCSLPTLRAWEISAVQGEGNGEAGFGEAIAPITPKGMKENANLQGLKLAFNPTHDGITYLWVDKASVDCYCQSGKWLRGEGTD